MDMSSFWELESLTQFDALVLGAGISGLSSAIRLKVLRPGWRIAVLERGLLPHGASTRNAGFACIGSLSEMLEDQKSMGDSACLDLVAMRHRGLALLRERLGDAAIGYAERGSHELLQNDQGHVVHEMERINDALEPVLGRRPFRRADGRIREFGFQASQVHALVENTCDGEIHTGKLMRALSDSAVSHGIPILTGARVMALESDTKGVCCVLENPVSLEPCRFYAPHVLVCTNGFAADLFPELDLQPGRGQVLLTEPVSELPFRGIFQFDQGYFYFRELEGRVLFGGGRNLDRLTEQTTHMDLNEGIQAELDLLLHTVILPGRKVEVAMRWSGIMGFGTSKKPLIQRYQPGIYLGLRLSGMGIALGTLLGDQLAELVLASS